jgi:putative transposase
MNKYNPKIHHRRSIRLKGYDYSQAGLYFITICCQDRACMYGEISNGQLKLNDAGKMVEKWYYELENKFPDVKCHAMIVMPNHFHCILENVGAIGADTQVSPYRTGLPPNGDSDRDEPTCSSLSHVVQWFKTMTTNEYIRGVKNSNWQPFRGKLWQRNYYEHIIRNDQSYHRISKYIIDNPAKWMDKKSKNY